MPNNDTIIALSSGSLPAGVAIVRISGAKAKFIAQKLIDSVPKARKLVLREIYFADKFIDKGLIAFFPAPNSFTGEDCLEFHLHGSKAVIKALMDAVLSFTNVRLAKAGEFTLRAFENGKLDLIEAEGLADLLAAETETQRVQALGRMSGIISKKILSWREELLFLRGQIEALLDFSDEGDIIDELADSFYISLDKLISEFTHILSGFTEGRIIREGFRIVLAGSVNAGKSSLINRLTKSDLAIVSSEEGTTRDVREVEMDINSQLVKFIDMAGFRKSKSEAENEGIRRAEQQLKRADLILWLSAINIDRVKDREKAKKLLTSLEVKAPIIYLTTKADLVKNLPEDEFAISVKSGLGIEKLLKLISEKYLTLPNISDREIFISHQRDRDAIKIALTELKRARSNLEELELAAHSLKLASDSLSRLLGELDPEQILGNIFANFCVGK